MDAGGDAGAARPRGKQAAVGGGLGVLIVAVIMMLMGKDPSGLMDQLKTQAAGPQTQTRSAGGGDGITANSPDEQRLLDFVSVVLGSTEDVWNQLFQDAGQRYQEPTLVRFRDQVNSACGTQSSAVGPFYCSGDDTIYIDLTFFHELAKRHSAAGDFAQAYVIAHEVGHHLQNILGYTQSVAQSKRGKSETEVNRLSVRQELHADFLAGVWAYYAGQEGLIEPGDREEALNAAAQIGDDTLQRKARGYVQPEGFTHGTAKQRQRWFKLGMDTGDMNRGTSIYELPYGEL